MLMVNLEDLISLFKAQRCFMMSLSSTGLDERQHLILRDVSRMNHEIVAMLKLDVPSMQELGKQAQEVMMLEELYQMEVVPNEENSAEGVFKLNGGGDDGKKEGVVKFKVEKRRRDA